MFYYLNAVNSRKLLLEFQLKLTEQIFPRQFKEESNEIKYSFIYVDLALSDSYLKVIIQCLELEIFIGKVEVLFYKKVE